ncbi:MAG TPA: hypothetical protein VGW38_10090 [Chloroflexota bacterium]|nr:hypothetical protein [Chloroflexota bacterium]
MDRPGPTSPTSSDPAGRPAGSLEDTRASYAWLTVDTPDEREHRVLASLRAVRTSLAAMFTRAERPAHQQLVDEPVDVTAIV